MEATHNPRGIVSYSLSPGMYRVTWAMSLLCCTQSGSASATGQPGEKPPCSRLIQWQGPLEHGSDGEGELDKMTAPGTVLKRIPCAREPWGVSYDERCCSCSSRWLFPSLQKHSFCHRIRTGNPLTAHGSCALPGSSNAEPVVRSGKVAVGKRTIAASPKIVAFVHVLRTKHRQWRQTDEVEHSEIKRVV